MLTRHYVHYSQMPGFSSDTMTPRDVARINRRALLRRWSPGCLGMLILATMIFGILFTTLLYRLL